MAGKQPKHPRKSPRKAAHAPASTGRPEIIHSSVYLPKPLHQALREIAFKQNCKIHDLIIEGIDTVIRRHAEDVVRKAR